MSDSEFHHHYGYCEKCWGDAYLRHMSDHDKTQTEHYFELLKERQDKPCTREEQAG